MSQCMCSMAACPGMPVCSRQVSVPTLLSMSTLQQAQVLDEAMPHQRWNLQARCWP